MLAATVAMLHFLYIQIFGNVKITEDVIFVIGSFVYYYILFI